VRLLAALAVVTLAGAMIVAATRWWTDESTGSDRLEITGLEPIGPFAVSGDDLPEGWPAGIVSPALLLRADVNGDPRRVSAVQPVGESTAYAATGVQEAVIPADGRIEIDLVVTPADCGVAHTADLEGPLVDAAGMPVPMSSAASEALAHALESLCDTGGSAPVISTAGARIDVFFRDRTLVMRMRVPTTADRVVLQPLESTGFRGSRDAEATIEGGMATARLRWLVSPAEAAGLGSPRVGVRAFTMVGGRAYPWVLDLRVPDVRVVASPPRNDGVDLAEVAPRPTGDVTR
jgi:hypothetical protein